jgi:hypothetical protein
MQLIEFSYRNDSWEIRNLKFREASLIVGKNATGKSRTLYYLNTFFNIISQTVPLQNGNYAAKFHANNNDTYIYTLNIQRDFTPTPVIRELFSVNGKTVLERTTGKPGYLWNSLSNEREIISPPANKLAIHVNRDLDKYPYLEDLAQWCEKSIDFRFASITRELTNTYTFLNKRFAPQIPKMYDELTDKLKSSLLHDLAEVGFIIEEINVEERDHNSDYLLLKEKDIESILTEYDLSQGLLRSVYLIIFLYYVVYNEVTLTITIDDLCEGLDYERATKLGKIVFDICRKNNIQLIATSNDMFLMDVIPLQYWNVLTRNKGVVIATNSITNPELFEKFKFTGLSNFDFFSSDYIAQKKSE